MRRLKELKNKYLTLKVRNIISIVVIILITLSFIDYSFNTHTYKEILITPKVYRAPANSAFSDQKFYNCVIKAYNQENGTSHNNTYKLSDNELQKISYLYCPNENINNAKGLEKLIGLKYLYLNNNNLSSIDITKNTLLEELNVSNNSIQGISLSLNKELKILNINNNKLKNSLYTKKNTKLERLDADNNSITGLDLSENKALKKLYISSNKLTSLNLSKCTSLVEVYASHNELTKIIAAGATALKVISAPNNSISTLDITNNPNLVELYASDNEITSFSSISKAPTLKKISLSNNKLTTFNVSNNAALRELWVYGNKLTSLTIAGASNLYYLDASNNKLTSLNVASNTKLKTLLLGDNKLTGLDITKNTLLTHLDVHKNSLTSIDVSKNTKLENFEVQDNELSSLSLSNNIALRNLSVDNNKLKSLNLSNNTKLKYISVYNNNFSNVLTKYVGSTGKANNAVTLPIQFSQSVKWKSNDDSIATSDFSGNITFVHKGTTDIVGTNKYYFTKTTVNSFKVDTKKYVVNAEEGYIYVGTDSDINVINQNISVPDYIDVEFDVKNNKLKLTKNNTVLKEFDIVRIVTGLFDVTSEYINIKHYDGLGSLTCYNCTANVDGTDVVIKHKSKEIYRYKLVNYPINYTIYRPNNASYVYTGVDSENMILDGVNTINCEAVIEDHILKIFYNNKLIDSLNIQGISSSDYIFGDNYVFTKTEDIDVTKVELHGNLQTQIFDGKFFVYNVNPYDRGVYHILTLKPNNMTYDNKNIYIGENTSYYDFISDLNKVGDITLKVYNGNTEITSGNIEAGMQLVILYNNKEIYRYNINIGYKVDLTGYDVRGNYIYLGYSDGNIDLSGIPTQDCTLEWINNNTELAVIYNGNVVRTYTILSYQTNYTRIDDYIYVGILSDEEIINGIEASNGIIKTIKNDRLLLSYNNDLLGEYKLIRLKSSKYVFPANGVVYTGTDIDETAILSNLRATNAEVFIEDNKVRVKRNNTVVNETYKINSIKVNDLTINNKEIELPENMSYESLINKINVSSNMTIKVLDIETNIVTEGYIEDGYILKVFYNDTEIDTYSLKVTNEHLEVSSSISIDDENNIIYNIDGESSLSSVLNKMDTTSEIVIKDKNNNVITDMNRTAKTGDKVILTVSNEEIEYKLSVKGDVTGAGKVTISDVMKAARYSNQDVEVEGEEYFKAADVTGDGRIDISDVMKIAKSIVDKTEL